MSSNEKRARRTVMRSRVACATFWAVGVWAFPGLTQPARVDAGTPVAPRAAGSSAAAVGSTSATVGSAGATPSANAATPAASAAATPPTEASGTREGEPDHGSDQHAGQFPPMGAIWTGSPFDSDANRHEAELLRSARDNTPKVQNQPGQGIPPGTVGMLVRDENRQPLVGYKVTLEVVRESIAEGNKESKKETSTDALGRAGFVGLNTESAYHYEAVVEKDGARYSSGSFSLRRDAGQIIVLYVYPTTQRIDETFIITRLLYALQPREDLFQVDAIMRLHNGGNKTWSPQDFYVELPEGASAFRPAKTDTDIRTVAEGNRIHITGSFTPGQHDFTVGFQLPNPRTPNIRLSLPTLPHLTDARVVMEASDTMGLQVEDFEPAKDTRGQEGQSALMAMRDFLGAGTPAPAMLTAIVTGMPGRSSGPLVASLLAGMFALFGIAFAVSRPDRDEAQVSDEDRNRARDLLLDELVLVERSFEAKEIGPKTYEQARRTLLDSLARLS